MIFAVISRPEIRQSSYRGGVISVGRGGNSVIDRLSSAANRILLRDDIHLADTMAGGAYFIGD